MAGVVNVGCQSVEVQIRKETQKMSLITAGASLIGGALSSRSARKNNKAQMDLAKNTIKYKVEDAQRAGVHPLYALGAPTMSSSVQTDQMGQAVADAGTAIGKGMTSQYEKEIQRLNLENLEAELTSKKLANADFVKQSINNSNLQRANEKLQNHTKIGGININQNKGWSNAEDIETRYGDLISWLYGIGVIGGDLKENLPRIEAWQEENRRKRDNQYSPDGKKWENKKWFR